MRRGSLVFREGLSTFSTIPSLGQGGVPKEDKLTTNNEDKDDQDEFIGAREL